ncbi:MAG: hypothetical protein NXI22_01365 [bacterium]|nr:hypothetical protein [bacterium]
MNLDPNSNNRFHPRDFLNALKKHWLMLVVPMLLCGAVAFAYSLIKSEKWQATQSLIVRDEALGESQQGRFDSVESMKTAQETIQEASRHPEVARAALRVVGPKSGKSTKSWPSDSDVESLRENISISAPHGTEFGRTEVIHLSVNASTQQRAIALTKAVGDQLENRLKTLRGVTTKSIIRELERSIALSEETLNDSTAKLQSIESEVGADLGELRILSESGGGESNLRNTLTQIKNELRQGESDLDTLRKQHATVTEAAKNPDAIVSTPSQVLANHPALGRLKNGLVDAQLHRAQLEGKMSRIHPVVRAAVAAELEVRGDLYRELQTTKLGLESDITISESRVASLNKQLQNVTERLSRLAKLRARYSNLADATRKHADVLSHNREKLADARARHEAAEYSSLINRVDEPHTGAGPVSFSSDQLVGVGLAGGAMLGLGLVFLTVPLGRIRGRRLTDFMPGRRGADQSRVGRRQADAQQAGRVGDQRQSGQRASDFLGATGPSQRSGDRRGARPEPTADISRDMRSTPGLPASDRPAPHPPANLDYARRRLDTFTTPTPTPTQHIVPVDGANPVY